jgi:hypothetical protein
MHIIRTAEDLARALNSRIDPELHSILAGHAERLSAYPDFTFEELAMIVVVEVGDRLVNLALVGAGGGRFSPSPEYVLRHSRWFEAVFVLSDDGFGIILLAEQGEGADPEVIAAFETELTLQEFGHSLRPKLQFRTDRKAQFRAYLAGALQLSGNAIRLLPPGQAQPKVKSSVAIHLKFSGCPLYRPRLATSKC